LRRSREYLEKKDREEDLRRSRERLDRIEEINR
jgi:hypothetical protein